VRWINQHQKAWRAWLLALLLVALIGPWWFDLIYVPAEYTCTVPNYRLEGNFCGIPMPGMLLMAGWTASGMALVVDLVRGAASLAERGRELLSLLLIMPVLPLFSMLLIILRGSGRGRAVFHLAALGLAVGLALLIGLNSHPQLFWLLWGVWLYVVLSACAVILEVMILVQRRRFQPG
jgi:hypothetical protein